MLLRSGAAVFAALAACGLVCYLALEPHQATEAVPQVASATTPVTRDLVTREVIASAFQSLSHASMESFDPFDAPTPEVGGQSGRAVELPILPSSTISIGKETLRPVGVADADALLTRPVIGRKSSPFGIRLHPVLGIWKLHTGLDWAAPCGTPVGAAAQGTVVRVGWAGGNGVQVKVDHGVLKGHRIVTTYNHLSSVAVQVGDSVAALDGVGRVGSTGYSTGCHLHFEVIADGQFTDPESWLNGNPVVVDLSKDQYTTVPTSTASPTPPAGLPPSSHRPTPTSSHSAAVPDLHGSSVSPAVPSPPTPSANPTTTTSTLPSVTASPTEPGTPSAVQSSSSPAGWASPTGVDNRPDTTAGS